VPVAPWAVAPLAIAMVDAGNRNSRASSLYQGAVTPAFT
jgi:hypothetical protein